MICRSAESKSDKAARLRSELARYRIETLLDAARILEQLDNRVIPSRAAVQTDQVIEFLRDVASRIDRES